MDMGGVPVTDIHKSAPANARTTRSGSGRIILGGAKSNKREYRNVWFFFEGAPQYFRTPKCDTVEPPLSDYP